MAPNLTQIANEFGFSNSQRDEKLGGQISLGFFIVGGVVSVFVGFVTDVFPRYLLFGCIVFLGESACLATYWTTTYEELFFCRVLTGVSIGGATPIIYSMLGDLYPGSSRVKVSTMVGIAMSGGIALGQLVAGLVGPDYGWRLPFVLIAAPALFCAILILLTTKEPRRGDQEEAVLTMRQSSFHAETTIQKPLSDNIQNVKLTIETFAVSQLSAFTLRPCSDPSIDCVVEESSDRSKMSVTSPLVLCIPSVVSPRPNLSSEVSRCALASRSISQPCSEELANVRVMTCQGGRRLQYANLSSTESGSAEITSSPMRSLLGSGALSSESISNVRSVGEETLNYSEKFDCTKVYLLLRTKTVLLMYLQGAPGCLPWGMVYAFLNDYFSADRGMSVAAATAALTVFGVGGVGGQLAGGAIGQVLYNRDKRLQCLLMGGSTMLAVFPMWYLINTPTPGDTIFYLMAFVAGFVVSANGPNVPAVLTNTCVPEARGTAFALGNLSGDLGRGFGPVVVVQLVTVFRGSRQAAFNVITAMWIVCGAILLSIAATVNKDEQTVQTHVRSSLLRQSEICKHSEPRDAFLDEVARAHTNSVRQLKIDPESGNFHALD